MKLYEKPQIIATYTSEEINDMIESGACSSYSVSCGCYGGGKKN